MKTRLLLSILLCLTVTQCVEPGLTPPGYEPIPPRPPTVRMPVRLTAQESFFTRDMEASLSNAGLQPVYRGFADYEVEWRIEVGPVNVDSTIVLWEQGRPLAQGVGRASGAPMVNRDRVVQNSFYRALERFDLELSRLRRDTFGRGF